VSKQKSAELLPRQLHIDSLAEPPIIART